jgi:hypothetical protein
MPTERSSVNYFWIGNRRGENPDRKVQEAKCRVSAALQLWRDELIQIPYKSNRRNQHQSVYDTFRKSLMNGPDYRNPKVVQALLDSIALRRRAILSR